MSNHTREVSLDKLVEGDVVVAVNGQPRPFPYTVTRVLTRDLTHKGTRYLTTQVEYAHGGIIPATDPRKVTATVVV